LLTRTLLLLAALSLAAACGETADRGTVEVRTGGLRIDAEIARTPDERAIGLSGRDSMARDAGMLFLLGEERVPGFTMAGMRFPLDFVWITADLRVAGVTEDVPNPGPSESPRSNIQPPAPVLYVLEVNAGVVREAGVRAGDAVEFEPALEDSGVR
jgi:uncharacterized membrane protein (UPF0127 family)